MVAEPTFDGIGLVGLEAFTLHLQGPIMLQLRLDPPHTQKVPEHHVIPKGRREGRRERERERE